MPKRRRSRLADIRTMKTLLPAAEAKAQAMGEQIPGAEHLVLAALDLEEGSARRAFERAGADPDGFAHAVAAQHAEALHSIGMDTDEEAIDAHIPAPLQPPGPLRSSVTAQQLFQEVVRRVRKERSQLYGAYIVEVAAQTEHGTTARAIRQMGVQLHRLAKAARTEINTLNSG